MQMYPPGTRIGQYEIASRPMMGGMGVVYFALDHGNDGRPVALKTFRPEFLPDRAARDRFLREGTAWIELGSHPHIVRCYKVESIEHTAFLILELIPKEQSVPDASLRSWLIPGSPLPIEKSLFFALQIARGMQHATKKIPGFVHHDLKPENILVGTDNIPGTIINRVRVSDFGLIKTVTDSGDLPSISNVEELKLNQVQFTRGAGTPLYMAPEQWNGEPVGTFTDVYAFGCIFLEMLIGKYPVEGDSIEEIQIAHLRGNLHPLPKEIPLKLSELLEKCLVIGYENRFQNWEDILNELGTCCTEITGNLVTDFYLHEDMTNQERVDNGWSHDAIANSYALIGKFELARDHFDLAYQLGQELHEIGLQVNALRNLGSVFRSQGQFDTAIEYTRQALEMIKELSNPRVESSILLDMGIIYIRMNQIDRALEYLTQSIDLAHSNQDPRTAVTAYANLAVIYKYLGKFGKAIELSELVLTFSRRVHDKNAEAITLGNLGNIYFELKKYDVAKICHTQSLQTAISIGDIVSEMQAHSNLGMICMELEQFQLSMKHLKQALNKAETIGDHFAQAGIFSNLGVAYHRQNDNLNAVQCLRRAISLFNILGLQDRVKVAQSTLETWELSNKMGSSQDEQAAYAVDTFMTVLGVTSKEEMQSVMSQNPILREPPFVNLIEQFFQQNLPIEYKAAFQQQLSWIKEIQHENNDIN